MKVTQYPEFNRIRNNKEIEELELLCRLIWLSSERILCFGSYNGKDWDNGVYPFLNANDTFFYASADAEDFEEGDLDAIMDLYIRFDWIGVAAWMANHRGMDVLDAYRTPNYYAAKETLSNPNYLPQAIRLMVLDRGPEMPLNKMILRAYKVIWLCSRDVLSFSTEEAWGGAADKPGLHLFRDIYAFSTDSPMTWEIVDSLIELYGRFGHSAFDAWSCHLNESELEWLKTLPPETIGGQKIRGENFQAALDYLHKQGGK